MSLKFRDDEERQTVVRLHAELYRRARLGEITTREMLRLSRALIAPYQKGLSAILVAQKGVIESSETEAKLVEVENKIAELLNQGVGGNIVKFKKAGPFD